MGKKGISILGSTGSVGTQVLDIVRAFPDRFQVKGLAAGHNVDRLMQQILEFRPSIVSILNEEDRPRVLDFVKDHALQVEVVAGAEGLETIATCSGTDLLMVAVFGTASLLPTFSAVQAGITIGLACKEVLVSAGDVMMAEAKKRQVSILPVDSEHAAIKQCLAGVSEETRMIDKLIITASGGPFRMLEAHHFASITVEDALRHPKWTMGPKITIDSATLVNKGLEVIEAHHLFGVGYDKIEVVVHPQSIIHSLVEFSDGTMLAQLGLPDMRFPIQYVMTYPEKWGNEWPKTKLSQLGPLDFFEPDFHKFPLLGLAFEVGKKGGLYPAIFNAANEAAVRLFLDRKISFLDIERLITESLSSFQGGTLYPTLEEIVAVDAEIKERVAHAYAI